MDVLRELVLPRLQMVKKASGGFMARCPAHEDNNPSLSISEGREQPVVLKCFAGCEPDQIITALDLTWAQLLKERDREPDVEEWTPCGPAIAVYDYVDEHSNLLFQVCRTADKKFPQRVPDQSRKSGWSWKLGDTRMVPYRLPKVIEAVQQGAEVWIVEGEKDVHTLEGLGLVATTSPGGAGKSWRDEYTPHFKDAVVVIVADKDDMGQKHARKTWSALIDVADSIRVYEAKQGKDITDHTRAGLGLEDLTLIKDSSAPTRVELAPDLWEFISTPDPDYDWLVPGLLERRDRVLVTGGEGFGKSTTLRQMAVTMAAGIDPFSHGKHIDPLRVLVIDCENSEAQSRRKYRPMAALTVKAGRRVADGNLRLIHRPEGIDLVHGDDAEWLMERVAAHKPDVLFLGPFYRLHTSNINDEIPARRTVAVLDAVRNTAGCALITEAHAGHGVAGQTRSLRPAGSSLLLRWPEFGIGLMPVGTRQLGGRPIDMQLTHWRGARDDRQWPQFITYGDVNDWPWKWSCGVPEDKKHVGAVGVDPDLSADALSKGTGRDSR